MKGITLGRHLPHLFLVLGLRVHCLDLSLPLRPFHHVASFRSAIPSNLIIVSSLLSTKQLVISLPYPSNSPPYRRCSQHRVVLRFPPIPSYSPKGLLSPSSGESWQHANDRASCSADPPNDFFLQPPWGRGRCRPQSNLSNIAKLIEYLPHELVKGLLIRIKWFLG